MTADFLSLNSPYLLLSVVDRAQKLDHMAGLLGQVRKLFGVHLHSIVYRHV